MTEDNNDPAFWIQRASEIDPGNEFVDRVRFRFQVRGYITVKELAALKKVTPTRPPTRRPGGCMVAGSPADYINLLSPREVAENNSADPLPADFEDADEAMGMHSWDFAGGE